MNSRVSSRLIRRINCSGHALKPEHYVCPHRTVIAQSRCLHGESIPAQPSPEPVRKLLRHEAKQKRLEAKSSLLGHSKSVPIADGGWELTVGIEIHAELDTERKLFSTAGTSINDTPNSNVALCDLGYPGAQPLFQSATLLPALRAALALGCDIQQKSSFDRKHYFYQDQPSGYQITQYYEPFAKNGSILLFAYDGIAPEDGPSVRIDIKQVQMEQDTAKSLIQPGSSAHLDFNRVSHPLIEIITLPVIHHPATAAACVRKIQAILKSVGAVTAGMELGGLRADVNVSVRRAGSSGPGNDEYEAYGLVGLGQRTEIKNLSSFKAVEDAIIAERDRQICVLEAGGEIKGETRGWTLGSTETVRLRGKEGEVDYRYMPDPDLGPLLISPALVERLRETLPMTPDDTMTALLDSAEHKLSQKDASTLLHIDDGERLDYYLDVLSQLKLLRENQTRERQNNRIKPKPQLAGNWVLHELGSLMSKSNLEWSSDSVPSLQLAQIIQLLEQDKITSKSARHLLGRLFSGDQRPVQEIAVEEKLMVVELGDEVYQKHAQRVLELHRDLAVKTTASDKGKFNHLVGQMMKDMARAGFSGAIQPAKAKEVMLETLSRLNNGAAGSDISIKK